MLDQNARNAHGDINGEGSAALFSFENYVGLTNHETPMAAIRNEETCSRCAFK